MRDILIFTGAAFFEIFGCFAFWLYLRQNKSAIWLIPGVVSIIVFAILLTQIQTELAGRAFAIYGGIYIAASLLWLYFVEHHPPDLWDLVGASLSIVGALIMLYMPR